MIAAVNLTREDSCLQVSKNQIALTWTKELQLIQES